MEQDKKKSKIGNIGAAIFIGFAAITDAATFIPLVGDFAGPIFWVLASVYLWKAGLGIINGRRLGTSVISMVAEMVPLVQALPTITVAALAIVTMVRLEEKTGISLKGKKPGITPPRMKREPLNEGGKRLPPKI